MGSSSQDLADALLIIFKTNSSVTDSKVSKGFPAKEVSGKSSWVWRRKIVSDGADFLSEVIRKDVRKVVRVKCWRKRWRSAFAEDGVEVLKELFTGCARLNLGRRVGLFGFIYKVCYFLFNGVVYLFADGELRFEPSSLRLPTLPFQLTELLRNTAEPGRRLTLYGLCNGREGRACQGQNRDGYCSHRQNWLVRQRERDLV